MSSPRTLTDADFVPKKTLSDADFQGGSTPAQPTPSGEVRFGQPGFFPDVARTMGRQALGAAMEPGESLVRGARQLFSPSSEIPAGHSRMEGVGNMAKGIGKAALMVGAPEGLGAAGNAIPTTARAGENFERAMQVAKDVPVDVNKFAEPVLRARKLNAVAGDPMAPVLRKALGHINPSVGEPLTYGDARILASSAGRKAQQTAMGNTLTGEMGKRLGEAAKGLDEATQGAADTAGVGPIHADAMNEYRRAKQIQGMGKNIAKVAVPAAIGAGAYKVGRALGVGGQ